MQNEMFEDDKNLDELLSKAEDIELDSTAWPHALAELVSIFKDEMTSSAKLDESKAFSRTPGASHGWSSVLLTT